MSQEEYDKTPATLKVREFKAGGKIMVTTFLCPKETPKAELKALYRSRWNVELDLRNIKTTLGMDAHKPQLTGAAICRHVDDESMVHLDLFVMIRES